MAFKVFIWLLFLLASIASYSQIADEAIADKRPNIILIIADDMDRGLVQHMPELKNLIGKEGTNFENYFVNVPNCCPSRASLLRGQYAHNTGVLANGGPYGGFLTFRDSGVEKSTIAIWLQKAGYHTIFLGKYLNGYNERFASHIPPGWNEWYGNVGGLYFDYKLNENGKVISYGRQEKDYETDVYAGKVTRFLQSNASSQPFFLYIAPHAPHTRAPRVPASPAPRHLTMLSGIKVPRPPSFNEADVKDKPSPVFRLNRLSIKEIETIDEHYRARAQSMLAVDEMIGNIVKTLAEKGILNNTYIFFTSDNGFHLGEHRIRIGKNRPYDESTRVPLLVRGPEVLTNRSSKLIAQNIDLAPTFAEIAGAKIPSFVDGVSLLRVLKNPDEDIQQWKTEALIEHWHANTTVDDPDFVALRTEKYLYVEHRNKQRELYDIEKDPFQITNIRKKNRALVSQLSKRLRKLFKQGRI